MGLRNLEYFVIVADEKSFERAAARLFLTQSAVSQQVRRLENELGAQLIDRSTRPFTLTGVGRDVYSLASSIVRQTKSIKGVAEDHIGSSNGIVRLGVTPSLLLSFVTEIIQRIRALLPGVKVELFKASTYVLQAEISQGGLDIVFMNTEAEAPEYSSTIMSEDELLLAYNPAAHPHMAETDPLPITNLNSTPIITFKRNEAVANYDKMFGYFLQNQASPRYSEVSGSYIEQLGFVKAGLGVAFVPVSLVDSVSIEDVKFVRCHPALPSIPIYTCWNETTTNRAVQSFMAALWGIKGRPNHSISADVLRDTPPDRP